MSICDSNTVNKLAIKINIFRRIPTLLTSASFGGVWKRNSACWILLGLFHSITNQQTIFYNNTETILFRLIPLSQIRQRNIERAMNNELLTKICRSRIVDKFIESVRNECLLEIVFYIESIESLNRPLTSYVFLKLPASLAIVS